MYESAVLVNSPLFVFCALLTIPAVLMTCERAHDRRHRPARRIETVCAMARRRRAVVPSM